MAYAIRNLRKRPVRQLGHSPSSHGLEHHGITAASDVFWNLSPDELYDRAIAHGDGHAAVGGALVVRTGACTGRRPKDRYLVEEPESAQHIAWGAVNVAMQPATFDRLHRKITAYYNGKRLFVRECYAGADPEMRLKVRVITEKAWHNLFAAQLFIKPEPDALASFVPDFTILNAPCAGTIPL